MKKMHSLFVTIGLSLSFLGGCDWSSSPSHSSNSNAQQLAFVDSATDQQGRTWLWQSSDSLHLGYQSFHLCLKQSSSALKNQSIQVQVWRIVQGQKVFAPLDTLENLDSSACTRLSWVWLPQSSDSLTQSAGQWNFNAQIGADSISFHSHLIPWNNNHGVVQTMDPTDSMAQFILAIVQPTHPQVGTQNLNLFALRRTEMGDFALDSTLTIQFMDWMPSMPSMGMTPGNVQPIFQMGTKGHYLGQIAFSMSGSWQIMWKFQIGSAIDSMSVSNLLVP